jgi:hypothetical protein
MQPQTHTPAGSFGHHIRYVDPLPQRPYVWTQVEQWVPRAKACLRRPLHRQG